MNAPQFAPPRPSLLSRPRVVCAFSAGLLGGLVLLLWSPWAASSRRGSSPLRFYCAAGMKGPVTELLKDFEADTRTKVEITFGGSGKMLAGIIAADGQGDLFLSADSLHMNKAKALGLVQEVIPVATLRPVLAISAKTRENLERKKAPIKGLKDLLRKDIKVVLANPEIAAIGQIGQKALVAHGLWKQLEADMTDFAARVSTVGTVNEVALAVNGNENTAGLVWSAIAIQMNLDIVPLDELKGYQEPLQLGILSRSKQPQDALALGRYLNASDKGGETFKKYHFEPTDQADPWQPRPEIVISAGAMLKPALEPIINRFEQREGVKVHRHYGGCGLLVSAMKAMKTNETDRFPDAFFACEISFLEQVKAWFDAGTLIARNDVVLVVARGKEAEIAKLEDLKKSHLRIGLGHPKDSALGALTAKVLDDLDLHEDIVKADRKHPIVYLPEGHMLAVQVRTGALDAALVYRSNVLASSESEGHISIVESERPHAIARQPFAIAHGTRHRQLLLRFQNMILSSESATEFRTRGFEWVGGKRK